MVTEVTVVDWIGDDELTDEHDVFGGLGGWFKSSEGHDWQHYLDHWSHSMHPHFEALRKECRAKRVVYGGLWHQNSEGGIPVFSDKRAFDPGLRSWGDFMAACWGGDYTDWAWSDPSPERLKELGVPDA